MSKGAYKVAKYSFFIVGGTILFALAVPVAIGIILPGMVIWETAVANGCIEITEPYE